MSALREEDMQLTIWRNLAVMPEMQRCAVRITHTPTGITVTANGRSELATQREALGALERALSQAEYRTNHDPDTKGEQE